MATFSTTTTICESFSPLVTATVWTGTASRPSPVLPYNASAAWLMSADCTIHRTKISIHYMTSRNFDSTATATMTLGDFFPANTTSAVATVSTWGGSGTGTIHVSTRTLSTLASTTVAETVQYCEPTKTVTQHAKCHPTNLIDNINGNGILGNYSPQNNSITAFMVPEWVDASTCCQLCLDNKGCGAMVAQPAEGTCYLQFTDVACNGGKDCGLIFQYQASDLMPIQNGLAVQEGCGTIAAMTANAPPGTPGTISGPPPRML
ncbi:MAG: hypothetical protein Q9227_000022 [Pyrenula ochraceoflavens]